MIEQAPSETLDEFMARRAEYLRKIAEDYERQVEADLALLAAIDPYKDDPTRQFLVWHGDEEPTPVPMLVQDTFPEVGLVCIAGQFSAGKTFIGFDLAVSVMTQRPFFGKNISRSGGVFWLAAEGKQEVTQRLDAALCEAGNHPAVRQPFGYLKHDVPALKDPDAIWNIERWIEQTNLTMERHHYMPVRMVMIDTISAAAEFVDEDKSVFTQPVYKNLLRLADRTKTLVVIIDHFGKAVETGIRGSSAKSASLDAILAVTADGDTKTATLKKCRFAPTGRAVPFALRPVQIRDTDRTTCVVDWATEGEFVERVVAKGKFEKPAWSGKSRLLKKALDIALLDHGSMQRPYGIEGPELRAVPLARVRAEFYAAYADAGSDTPGTSSKRTAFNRLLGNARDASLITSREIAGVDWIWITDPSSEPTVPSVAHP